MEYISVAAFAAKHGIAERTVRNYCASGKIEGAFLTGKTWNIPADAALPRRKPRAERIMPLLEVLREQKAMRLKGGIYHRTQIDLTYNSSKTNYYNVHLFLVCYTKTGNSSLGIHFSSGFTLEDPGVYTSADIPDSSPGSGGGSGSGGVPDWDPNIPEFARQDCLTCGGSGNCTRCGGSGYTYNDDIKSSCRSCHGSGDCSSCGGTGKR